MRITETAKRQTRERIEQAACELFKSVGYEEATTREIARGAGIATGTLFNYFPTKEAIVMTLVAESLRQAQQDFDKKRPGEGASLDEEIFAYVAAGLRRVKPYRTYIQPVLETALSPLAKASANETAESMRLEHLETVRQIVARHSTSEPPSAVAMHLYWTLYTGVLAFWASDDSPKQEDTLAMLDQSLRMFVHWFRSEENE